MIKRYLKNVISQICEQCYFKKGVFETRSDGIRLIRKKQQQIFFYIPETRRYIIIKLNNKKEFKEICEMFPEKVNVLKKVKK